MKLYAGLMATLLLCLLALACETSTQVHSQTAVSDIARTLPPEAFSPPEKVRPLTTGELAKAAAMGPVALLVDQRPLGLSIQTPPDGSRQNRIWITAPGLPFTQGRVEVTVYSLEDTAAEQEWVTPIFEESYVYLPVSETAELYVDLPERLADGRYEVEARLRLFGDAPGIDAGEVERARRQGFVRGHGAAPDLDRHLELVVGGYRLNQKELSAAQARQWEKLLADLERVEVTKAVVVGHSCDVGLPWAKERVSRERAMVVADLLKQARVPEDLLYVVAVGDAEPLLAAGGAEQIRMENRRVVVRLVYRSRPSE